MSACPYCFYELRGTVPLLRCTGSCAPAPDQDRGAVAIHGGKPLTVTPLCRPEKDEQGYTRPYAVCSACHGRTVQEVCPQCHTDLPEGWRRERTLTVAVTGARGSGKSVYIAVFVSMLKRYISRRGAAMDPVGSTADQYQHAYYERVFDNKALSGTTPGFDDVLMWRIKAPAAPQLFLVVRDVAGEDIERLTATRDPAFSFLDHADLLIFLFDPLMLPKVQAKLDGVIATPDASRLGDAPHEALPKVLSQTRSGKASLALVVSKFDSLHRLAQVSGRDELSSALTNPAAHFNWDHTLTRLEWDTQAAQAELDADLAFLDVELRSLMRLLSDESVTVSADRSVEDRVIASVGHFAVSSVGDSAQHSEQLSVRGITPFRVLDPLLWALSRSGYWI